MKVIEITQYSEKVLQALNDLLPQLSSSVPKVSSSSLREIIRSGSSRLLMAEKDGVYYGTLTLTIYSTPTGIKAWIDDLVVDEETRGKGVGRKLIERALALVKGRGAVSVDLTSRPFRESANALYKKIGFIQRETNVYRYRCR